MKSLVLISENKSIKDFFKIMLNSNINLLSSSGIDNLINFTELCKIQYDFIIDITGMSLEHLSYLIYLLPIELNITVIASIPMRYLPKDYKKILSLRPIRFFEYPLSDIFLKELKHS